MRCPKCGMESGSDQIEHGQCAACGVYFHKLKSVNKKAETVPVLKPGAPSRRSLALSAMALLLVAVLIGAGFWAHGFYRKQELIAESAAAMRLANSYVSELLDESARLTNAGYLEKAPRRIEQLDTLIASALAIDDSAAPGLAKATADYAKGSRAFVNSFTRHVQADIRTSVAEAGHRVYDDFARSDLGQYILAKSDEQILNESRAAMAQVQAESDLMARTDLVVTMTRHHQLAEKRQKYLDSKNALDAAKEQSRQALLDLNDTGVELGRIGRRVSDLAGTQMPVQAWQIPSR